MNRGRFLLLCQVHPCGAFIQKHASFWGGGGDVPPVEFLYHVFTCMPGQSYHRRLGFVVVLVLCILSAN